MLKRDENVLIRPAVIADLPQLVDIFNHYILNSHAIFTTEPFTVESRKPWFDSYGQDRHRLLVAESEDGILGYTTSSRYEPRPAFDFTVETSVYLHPEKRLVGIGSKLYSALFEALKTQPVHLALAAIANPNPASIALHRKFGFEEVGTFKEYAQKNNVWISSTWFQKPMNGL